jgi:hypothetical protein
MPVTTTKSGATDRSSMYRANPGILVEGMFEAGDTGIYNYSHERAVQGVAHLSAIWRRNRTHMSKVIVSHRVIIKHLRERRVSFVLTGMYGIAGWLGRSRATYDVDLLVKGGRNYARAVSALKSLYPQLEPRTRGGLTRFYATGEEEPLIDVVYPFRADQEETLATAIWIEEKGLRYRIPRLEAALANKYGAALTTVRSPSKRTRDMADFFDMVRHSMDKGRKAIDLELLKSLGEKVWPDGGGEEILRLVAVAKANQVPTISFK